MCVFAFLLAFRVSIIMPRTCLKMQPLTPPSATTLFLCNILPSPFSSPAQSAATKTVLFHIALITPDLFFPVRTQRCVHQVHWILVFSVSNFTLLSYLVLMVLVQPQKPSSLWPLCLLHTVCQALLMPHLLLTSISFSSTVHGHIASSAVS